MIMHLLLDKTFYRHSVWPLLLLAGPLILTGLIESSAPFFGTIFLAELGQQELAAGALVRGLFFALMVTLWGTLTAVSVLVAQKYGEKDNKAVSQILRDGTLLSLMLTPPTFLLLWYAAPIFLLFGQNQSVVLLAQDYMRALAWGILPDFISLVLMQFIIGLGHTRTSMIFMLFWVPIAIFFNYALIFGAFGLPKCGIAGIGWGMTVSYWITAIGLIIYLAMSKTYKHYIASALSSLPVSYLNELLQIGLPMGSMYLLEVGFFFVLTLMIGWHGQTQLAATQIVMQYLGMLTSVVFSIAGSVTVRMGHKIGEKDIVSANNASHAGVFLSVTFMLITAVCYLFFPERLIAIDLDIADPKNWELIHYSKQFFIVCAVFQLFEAVRISLFGSLRALKDTHFTLLASVFGFWVIPLPLGYFLSLTSLGGTGLWCGMAVGAATSALLLNWRFKKKIQDFYKPY
jgi:MATE family multidrug resistance protein